MTQLYNLSIKCFKLLDLAYEKVLAIRRQVKDETAIDKCRIELGYFIFTTIPNIITI